MVTKMVLALLLPLLPHVATHDDRVGSEEVTSRPLPARNSTLWNEYRTNFTGKDPLNKQKTYPNSSYEESRARIFYENVGKIEEHNELYQNGSATFQMGINQFSDLTEAEQHAQFHGIKIPDDWNMNEVVEESGNETIRHKRKVTKKPTQSEQQTVPKAGAIMPAGYVHVKAAPKALKGGPKAPASLDLRKTGEVNAVRSQGMCGSCYTFSALAAVESAYYRKHKKSIDFSEQQALECWPGIANRGCDGGWPRTVLQGIQKTGITTESAYPYRGQVGGCRTFPQVSKIASVHQVPADIQSIKNGLNNHGVLSICVDTANQGFMQYRGGIFFHGKTGCTHATSLVGYGSEGGREYWIMRNSWATTWGEHGYMKIDMKSPVSGFMPHGASFK